LWEAGELPSEQRQEFKETEWDGMRAEIGPCDSRDRAAIVRSCHWWDWTPGTLLGTAATATLAGDLILNCPLLLCVTCS